MKADIMYRILLLSTTTSNCATNNQPAARNVITNI